MRTDAAKTNLQNSTMRRFWIESPNCGWWSGWEWGRWWRWWKTWMKDGWGVVPFFQSLVASASTIQLVVQQQSNCWNRQVNWTDAAIRIKYNHVTVYLFISFARVFETLNQLVFLAALNQFFSLQLLLQLRHSPHLRTVLGGSCVLRRRGLFGCWDIHGWGDRWKCTQEGGCQWGGQWQTQENGAGGQLQRRVANSWRSVGQWLSLKFPSCILCCTQKVWKHAVEHHSHIYYLQYYLSNSQLECFLNLPSPILRVNLFKTSITSYSQTLES